MSSKDASFRSTYHSSALTDYFWLICYSHLFPLDVHRLFSSSDYENLEESAKNAIKEKQPFVRLELSKDNLLEMFKVGPFLSFSFYIFEIVLVPFLTMSRYPLLYVAQYVQGTGDRVQDPQWIGYDSVPLWLLDRSVPWSSYPSHWPY